MRKLAYVAASAVLLFLPAAAQCAPRADVFLGYSYLRVRPGSGVPDFNLNGGSASIAFYPRSYLGLVADVGGYRGSDFGGAGVSGHVVSYLFGPRLVLRAPVLQPYVQALFGGAHATALVPMLSIPELPPSTSTSSENSFAMAVGGGVDYKVAGPFAIRLGQAEYFLTRFTGASGSRETQKNFRFSTGVVIRF